MEVEGNSNNCLLYESSDIKSCLICEDGYYISQNQVKDTAINTTFPFPHFNGYCCPEGTQYVYSATEGHTCESITIANCNKVNCTYAEKLLPYLDAVTCNCTECSEGFSIHGTGAASVCCNDLTEYYDGTVCTSLPDGCAFVDSNHSYICTQCKSTHKAYIQTFSADTSTTPHALLCCNYDADPRMWY